jgi:hypothetical protein
MNEQLTATASVPSTVPPTEVRALPSGRSVTLRIGPDQEEIELRSPDGEVEVRITLTEQGPVVQLRAARLELAAADEVRVECERFAIQARQSVNLQTEGDVSISAEGDLETRTQGETHINGKMIYLN